MQILYSSHSFSFVSEVMQYLDSNFSLISSSCISFSQKEKLVILRDHLENDVIIISSIKNNDDFMETLSIIDVAIRSGAMNIVLVAPYLAYSRQDKMISPYSSVGSEIIIKILKSFGVSKIITCDLHSNFLLEQYGDFIENVELSEILSFHHNTIFKDIDLIVAPDAGMMKKLSSVGLEVVGFDKIRCENDVIVSERVVNDFFNKKCIIIDDIYDSGATLNSAYKMVMMHNPSSVKCFVTHYLNHNSPNIKSEFYTTDSLYDLPKDINLISIASVISQKILNL